MDVINITFHTEPLVLLADEKRGHTHASPDAHRGDKDLLVRVLGDAKTGHDLTGAG